MSTLALLRPLTGLESSGADETYRELEPDIVDKVRAMTRKLSLDFDEAMSVAFDAFLKAYQRFDGESASFRTWVLANVEWSLIDAERRISSRRKHWKPMPGDIAAKSDIGVDGVLDKVGKDAAVVIQMMVEAPEEILAAVRRRGDKPRNYLSVCREYLMAAGWASSRVSEAFDEIRQALTG